VLPLGHQGCEYMIDNDVYIAKEVVEVNIPLQPNLCGEVHNYCLRLLLLCTFNLVWVGDEDVAPDLVRVLKALLWHALVRVRDLCKLPHSASFTKLWPERDDRTNYPGLVGSYIDRHC